MRDKSSILKIASPDCFAEHVFLFLYEIIVQFHYEISRLTFLKPMYASCVNARCFIIHESYSESIFITRGYSMYIVGRSESPFR